MEEETETQQEDTENETSELVTGDKNSYTIFDVCKSEYESEKARTNTIDFKASIVSAIVTAALALVIQALDLGNLFNMSIPDKGSLIAFVWVVIVGTLSFLSFLTALILLLATLFTRTYQYIDCYTYLDSKELSLKDDDYRCDVAKKFVECLDINSAANGRRCRLYNFSIGFLLAGVVLLTVLLFLKAAI